jgi:hypothetical protein
MSSTACGLLPKGWKNYRWTQWPGKENASRREKAPPSQSEDGAPGKSNAEAYATRPAH